MLVQMTNAVYSMKYVMEELGQPPSQTLPILDSLRGGIFGGSFDN